MRNDSTHPVPLRDESALHILETKLADPQSPFGYMLIFFWIGRRKPRIDLVRPKPDHADLLRAREIGQMEWGGCAWCAWCSGCRISAVGSGDGDE